MGLFGRSTPVPEPVLPIPRETRIWPKAMPAVKAAPPPPPVLKAQPVAPPVVRAVSAPAPAAVVKAPPPPPAATSSAPTIVKPSIAAKAAPEGKPSSAALPRSAASEGKPSIAAKAAPSIAAIPRMAASEGEPAPPAAHREASSVVAAFASWKQATSAKTAAAGKTETAPANVPPPRREDPVMYVYRAAAKQVRGEHDAAIEDLTKAIEIDPTCTTAWAGRALSLEAKGDLAGARRDYAKSIEIELRQEIDRLARPL